MIGILHSRTIQSLTPKSASIRTSSFQLFVTWSASAPIFYLVAARQFIQAHDLRLCRFLHGLHLNSDNSANVGSRPFGVSLSTTHGRICDKCLVISSSERPDRWASAFMMSGPR